MNVSCHLKKIKQDSAWSGLIAQYHFVITQENLGSLDICAQSPNRLSVGVGKNGVGVEW